MCTALQNYAENIAQNSFFWLKKTTDV